jgi:hypothetical protein
VIERVDPSRYSVSATPSSATPRPTPTAPRSAAPSATCVHGWREPSGAQRQRPLTLLGSLQKLDPAAFAVVDLRSFTDRAGTVRVYGQVAHQQDRRFAVRFLADGSRVLAVAAYLSDGFAAPDWLGVPAKGTPQAYPGLPGTWPGPAYDFVASKRLPAEVAGCLA